jgi:transcriptional regulator with XRE-family HTH domain
MGERIAEARGRAGLTQADLAAAISLDRSALAKIEIGTRRVSALELARIADALDERIEWFVTETPAAILSHRNLQEPGAASPAIDRLVERITRNVEFVATHDDGLRLGTATPLNRPSNMAEAEQAAAVARELLGLSDGRPFLRIADGVAGIGLLAFAFDLGVDAADAASILLTTGGVAVVNGSLQVGRRRLALAHELGHHLFADEYNIDWRVAEQDDDAWEARLDRFARAVLLPPDSLRDEWTRLRDGGDDLRTAAVKIGSAFCVDMSTLARRLTELGHISNLDARVVRAVRTTKADIIEFDLCVRHELTAPALPRRYEESVLRLYRGEVVSAARATELLFDTLNEDDLPVLPPVDEGNIWKFVS